MIIIVNYNLFYVNTLILTVNFKVKFKSFDFNIINIIKIIYKHYLLVV